MLGLERPSATCPPLTAVARSSRIDCRAVGARATTATDGEHDCNRWLPGDRDVARNAGQALIVAWFRPIGADEVAYHRDTVLGREDDHPGASLAYYGSRGETPLRWGGAGSARLGLTGEVMPQAYEAAFGPRGFHHPATGEQLVATRRPGFELVVSAHKSVAVLGVIERADEMHSILDVETSATMDWLDGWFQERGGRRGRAQARTATGGLTYAVTRHATSRAGDPSPHDHVLVANVVEMRDEAGGVKGLDSAALRDTVEAATMVGRLHSAARAGALGFDIEPDDGPSGNLRHWRIVGIPEPVCELFSKRADEIADHLATTGQHGYRARGVAARATRSVKRHTGADELARTWRAELEEAGWPVGRLAAHMAASQKQARALPFPMTAGEIAALADDVLDVDGRLLSQHKVFTRTHLISDIAPRLYGRDPAELDRVLDHITASRQVVPLIGIAGAREQAYTTAEVLAAEAAISRTVEHLAERPGPALDRRHVAAVVAGAERDRGHPLTPAQRHVVERLCCSGRAVSVVVGVAGSGKTTALGAATAALQAAGYRVLGTSTSGQAARTLAVEANVEARTFASLLWRLDRGQVTLDDRTVVVADEAGMADDTNLARLALAAERARASLVLVGDHRQLAAVGPGGALAAVLDRRPDVVVVLDTNVRQRDAAERTALAELRDGSVPRAVAWYAQTGRIHTQPARVDTLVAMADAWATDHAAGHDTALLAWRRTDVDDLNRIARARWDTLGRLHGDDVLVDGGHRYAVGDRLVALAPNPEAGIVTSEPLTVLQVSEEALTVRTSRGREVTLTGYGMDVEHVDYGYALTVHRAQGATYDRAHVLAAGGGRELGYVALSRARDRTTIHATADDIPQAVDDFQADWGVARHQRWITDTPARPGRHPEPAQAAATVARVRRLPQPTVPERQAVARRQLAALERDYQTLCSGTGRWHRTVEGAAARDLRESLDRLDQARRTARDPKSRWRDRRATTKALPGLQAAAAAAEHRWNEVGKPAADMLQSDIRAARRELDRLDVEATVQRLNSLQERTPGRGIDRDLGMSL
jgi:conjugative relaxase-like TrwC/TraI family protein